MHRTATREEWLIQRRALLAREKELMARGDELAAARRQLPWVRIDKPYAFDTVDGRRTLADLFAGRRQLYVYHFMFGPDWKQGCVGCSFLADHVDGANRHLQHHDVSFVAVSRAPLDQLLAYKRRMGWDFAWVSSAPSDFNYDFGVSFRPEDLAKGKVRYNYEEIDTKMEDLHGSSVFAIGEDGAVYHTYSSYGRGDERLLGTYMVLDVMPFGRAEDGPNKDLTDWVKRHDEYDSPAKSNAA